VAHVVQRTDTLALIADRYGSDTADIVTVNGLVDPNVIYPGQVLLVPLPSVEAAQQAVSILIGASETPGAEPEYSLAAPTLLSPDEGAVLSGSVDLAWQADGELEEGQYYAILVWWDGQPGPCCLVFVTDRVQALDLDGYAPGTFFWTVRVVEGRRDGQLQILQRFLSPGADRASFTWSGLEQ
jgi:murein DD-endopeptidase MepM/ murein hydrolase activator NlpD